VGASQLRLSVEVGDLAQNLQTLGDSLDDPLRQSVLSGAEMVGRDARPLVAGKPPWVGSTGEHALPITYQAVAATGVTIAAYVTSQHPGAKVQEYGGDIHPQDSLKHGIIRRLRVGSPRRQMIEREVHGPTIHIEAKHAVGRAGEADEAAIERDLEDAVDRLVRLHGF
jgi:hypothetical protein